MIVCAAVGVGISLVARHVEKQRNAVRTALVKSFEQSIDSNIQQITDNKIKKLEEAISATAQAMDDEIQHNRVVLSRLEKYVTFFYVALIRNFAEFRVRVTFILRGAGLKFCENAK